ncbi:hypothetical protein NAS141_07053 [Sulfitobacter sp. NAS-14.1]|nr:hypothetical protein C1J04_11595 [Sulfitobacter sp. SK025]EAP81078.1 hypothetical protein NAS141_07053 [Sulfitobacter sp. NAS-14.1]
MGQKNDRDGAAQTNAPPFFNVPQGFAVLPQVRIAPFPRAQERYVAVDATLDPQAVRKTEA